MIILVLTKADLEATIQELLADSVPRPVTMALSHSSHLNGTEWLAVRKPLHRGSMPGRLFLWGFHETDTLTPEEIEIAIRGARGEVMISLGLGLGRLQGQIRVAAYGPEGNSVPLRIHLVGPGMETLDFPVGRPRTPISLHWFSPRGLYSRAIGPVGGLHAFAALQRSRIAIVGAGGNGSLMAMGLARLMGPQGKLALIDPDVIEAHNLITWAMPGGCGDRPLLGRSKAEVLADCVRQMPDPPEVEVIVRSAQDWTAQEVLKRYPVLIACVDNSAARYAVAYIAALYHRVLLDVATGAFLGGGTAEHQRRLQQDLPMPVTKWGSLYARLPRVLLTEGPRTLGGDVRLIVPGHTDRAGNCLLCYGGVGSLEEITPALVVSSDCSIARPPTIPFWAERAGSLYMVNSDVVSMGTRLLSALLGGEAVESRHWQMNLTLTNPPLWREVNAGGSSGCPLCARAGRGDDAWNERSQAMAEYLLGNKEMHL